MFPPITEVGATLTPANSGTWTLSVPVAVLVPNVAVMVAVMLFWTAVVVVVKVADVDPPGTVTVAGTEAFWLFEVRLTVIPEEGAVPDSVTVPVEFVPPVTAGGEKVTLLNPGGFTVSVAVLLPEGWDAVIVTGVEVATPVVVTVKVAEFAPAGMRTDAGTVAQLLFDASVTVVPPGPLGPLRVTVPVEGLPPGTAVGVRLIELNVGSEIVSVAV